MAATRFFPEFFGNGHATALAQLQLQLGLRALERFLGNGGARTTSSAGAGIFAVEQVVCNQTMLAEFPSHNEHLSAVLSAAVSTPAALLELSFRVVGLPVRRAIAI